MAKGYEIVQSSSNSFAAIDIPIYVAYTANVASNSPGLSIGTVAGSYGPLSTVTTVSDTESIPRFANDSTIGNLFAIEPCACTTLGMSSANFGAAGGPGSFPVTATGNCPSWSAFLFFDWITVSPPQSHIGDATINYTVAPNNTLVARNGFVSAGGAFTVNQAVGVCNLTISPSGKAFTPAGGSGSITVNPNIFACGWTALSNASWITTPNFGLRFGNSLVYYLVQANFGASRTGTLTVAGQTYTITQQGQAGPSPVSMSPVSGGGISQSFVYTFFDPDSWQDLGVVNILINNFLDGRYACYLVYDRPNNVMYLVNDPGTAISGMVLNGSGTLSNSQCTVNGTGSSASGAGDTLTLTVALTFSQTVFAGEKVAYLAARDVSSNNSGWRTHGVWSVPRPTQIYPLTNGVSPSEGWGSGRLYSVSYYDANEQLQSTHNAVPL